MWILEVVGKVRAKVDRIFTKGDEQGEQAPEGFAGLHTEMVFNLQRNGG